MSATSDAIAARLQGAGHAGVANILGSLLPVTFAGRGAIAGMPHETVLRFWRDAFEFCMPSVTQFQGEQVDVLRCLRLNWAEGRIPPTTYGTGDVRIWSPGTEWTEQVAWIEPDESPYLHDKAGDGLAMGIVYRALAAPGFDPVVNVGDGGLEYECSLAHSKSNAFFGDMISIQKTTPATTAPRTHEVNAAFAGVGVPFPPTAGPSHNLLIAHGASLKQTGVRDVIVNGHGWYDSDEASFVDAAVSFGQDDIERPWQVCFMGGHQGGWTAGNRRMRSFNPMSVMCREFGPFTVARRYLSVEEWQIIHPDMSAYDYTPVAVQERERLARLVQEWSIGQTSAFLSDVDAGMDPNLIDDDTLKRRYAVPLSFPVDVGLVHAYTMDEASGNPRVDTGSAGLDLAETLGSWDQVEGKSNKAAFKSTGGSSLLSGANAEIVPGDNPFTVSFWTKFDGPVAALETMVAVGPDEANMVFRVALNSTQGVYFTSAAGAGNILNPVLIDDDGLWHHICGRRNDDGFWSLWVDGVSATAVNPADIGGTAGPLSVGQHAGGTRPVTPNIFQIDELYIYNRALTDREILRLAANRWAK